MKPMKFLGLTCLFALVFWVVGGLAISLSQESEKDSTDNLAHSQHISELEFNLPYDTPFTTSEDRTCVPFSEYALVHEEEGIRIIDEYLMVVAVDVNDKPVLNLGEGRLCWVDNFVEGREYTIVAVFKDGRVAVRRYIIFVNEAVMPDMPDPDLDRSEISS